MIFQEIIVEEDQLQYLVILYLIPSGVDEVNAEVIGDFSMELSWNWPDDSNELLEMIATTDTPTKTGLSIKIKQRISENLSAGNKKPQTKVTLNLPCAIEESIKHQEFTSINDAHYILYTLKLKDQRMKSVELKGATSSFKKSKT